MKREAAALCLLAAVLLSLGGCKAPADGGASALSSDEQMLTWAESTGSEERIADSEHTGMTSREEVFSSDTAGESISNTSEAHVSNTGDPRIANTAGQHGSNSGEEGSADGGAGNTGVKEEGFQYIVSKKSNYIARLPKDLFRVADIVVKGRFEETVSTFVSNHSMPVTRIMFAIEEVYKGEADSDRIAVDYYGGTVSLSDYLKTLSPGEIVKLGPYSADDLQYATVTYAQTKESVVIESESAYLLFLSHDAENDIRFILCDAYGACKMKDGLIYDLVNDAYILPDFLSE